MATSVLRVLPFVAFAAVFVALLVTAVWHEGMAPYESPCIVSWDENDGDSTLCVLTERAARLEHQHPAVR